MKGKISTYRLAVAALFTAVACVLAPLSIPIGPVPVSLTIMVMFFSVVIQGWQFAELSCIVYLLLGAVGLPVFSGYGAGLAKLLGPTGGYLIGYIPMIPIIGLFLNLGEKMFKKYSIGYFVLGFVGMILGTAVAYVLGTLWYMFVAEQTLSHALEVCVYPFIGIDVVKMILALSIGSFITKQLAKAGMKLA